MNRRNGYTAAPPRRADDIEIELPPPANEKTQKIYDKIWSGTERIFSIPEKIDGDSKLLKQYLNNLKGKNVCVAFWGQGGGRFEKCGVLTEVGGDYIVLKEPRTKRLIITTMDKIKYISVFCV